MKKAIPLLLIFFLTACILQEPVTPAPVIVPSSTPQFSSTLNPTQTPTPPPSITPSQTPTSPTATPTVVPTSAVRDISLCPDKQGSPSATNPYRMLYLQDNNLWLQDEGQAPTLLKNSGTIKSFQRFPQDERVFYIQVDRYGRDELWAATLDGRAVRLAAPPYVRGSMTIGPLSSTQTRIAFTLTTEDEMNEVWVANTDASGAWRVLNDADLRAVLDPSLPPETRAAPVRLTWLPASRVLLYDAFPQVDGIWVDRPHLHAVNVATLERFETAITAPPHFSPDGSTTAVLNVENLTFTDASGANPRLAGVNAFASGMGESFFFPPLVWLPDSSAVLLAQFRPTQTDFPLLSPVDLWRVPADGSPAVILASIDADIVSFMFSPDASLVTYWQTPEPFPSNMRELHIARLPADPGQPLQGIIYDRQNLISFLSWTPDSRSFLYSYGYTFVLGSLCAPPRELTYGPYTFYASLGNDRFILYEVRQSGDQNFYDFYIASPSAIQPLVVNLPANGLAIWIP